MINRVFCYSNEEAKRNGNNTSIGKMLLQSFGVIVILLVVLAVASAISADILEDPIFFLTVPFIFTVVLLCHALNFNFKSHSQLTGFATDSDNNVYFVSKLNNGEEFVISGMAAGNIIDKVLDDNNSLAGNLAEGAGAIMSLYSLNKSAKIMQNPEIIAKLVECANTTTGAEVRQILKVYNYTENSHRVKIKCDYRIMRSGKIKYNKTMKIYKSYNCFNELMNNLLSTRGN